MSMYLGAHVKSSGGVWKAVEEGERLGCEAIQIFAGSPRTWKPQTYRDAVLPPAVTARISIEAGFTFGWQRWVGSEGACIGIDHFGASAPAEMLFEKFGLTVEKVLAEAKRIL